MSEYKNMKEYVYDRDQALTHMDLQWVRDSTTSLNGKPDEVVLMTIHKARYEAVGVSAELRHESREWLQARGLRRLAGEFLPKDQLPS